MDKNEITVGRKVEKDDYQIEEKYELVSRKHARLIREPDGSIFIEDLNSANGTFVNEISIVRKRITVTDRVMLGGANYYELDLTEVFNMFPISDEDFRNGFLRLKKVYDDYKTESTRLTVKSQEDMMNKRVLPSTLAGIVLTCLTQIFVGDDANLKKEITIIGSLLTALVLIVSIRMASRSSKLNREKLNQLNEKFELDYVCPNPACPVSFKGKTWEFLKRQGKCLSCKREWKEIKK